MSDYTRVKRIECPRCSHWMHRHDERGCTIVAGGSGNDPFENVACLCRVAPSTSGAIA